MIKELENNLKDIPENFANRYYEGLGDHKQIYNYCDDIKYGRVKLNGKEKIQIFETGYYSGYEICINDLKNMLTKKNKSQAIDLVELIMHDLDITKGDISNNFND